MHGSFGGMNSITKHRTTSIVLVVLILAVCVVAFGQNGLTALQKVTPASNADTAPPLRAHHDLVYDEASQTILLTGGSTPLNGGQSFVFYNDIWRFDGKQWKHVGSSGNERSGMRLAFDSKRNKIFSYGGFAGNQSLGDLRVLENGQWKTLLNDTAMKAAEPGFVYDVFRDRLVAFGGSGSRDKLHGITWEWDGKQWKRMSDAGPEPRQAFAMVYDAKRKKTVLFGGLNTMPRQLYNDTWEWDGKTWTLVDTSGPSKRASPGCAYDEKRGQVVIFGGMGEGGMLGDTWAWNGKEWKKLADAGPSPRAMGYMAYDKKRDKIVLFGGRKGWPNDANDTWEWNGKEWTSFSKLTSQTLPSNNALFNSTGSFYAISVPDLDASVKWYAEKLDLKVILQTPRKDGFSFAMLGNENFVIELVSYDAALPLNNAAPSIKQNHLVHGIFKVGILVDDLEKVIDHLKKKEVEIVMGPYPGRGGRRSNLAIKDNSGNLILFLGK